MTQYQLNERLFTAAKDGDVEAVKKALEEGADINGKTITGFTPLHFAADRGYRELAKILIDKDADINAKDDSGQTPLQWAVDNEHTEMVVLLEQNGGVASHQNN